jgi:hypothetical protein
MKAKAIAGSSTSAAGRSTGRTSHAPTFAKVTDGRKQPIRGFELKEVELLRETEAEGDLFVLTSTKSETVTAPPPAEEPAAEDTFL